MALVRSHRATAMAMKADVMPTTILPPWLYDALETAEPLLESIRRYGLTSHTKNLNTK